MYRVQPRVCMPRYSYDLLVTFDLSRSNLKKMHFYTFACSKFNDIWHIVWLKHRLSMCQKEWRTLENFLRYWLQSVVRHRTDKMPRGDLYIGSDNYGLLGPNDAKFGWAHGKSPCDGIGGTLKRLAKQASLQGTLIETPLQFYHYLQANVTGTHVEYFLKSDWIKESETLHPRFAAARTVPGTRNVHCVCPSSRAGMVVVKWFSGSATEREVRVTKQ